MNTFLIVLISGLMTLVSHASEREFRIDRHAVDSGYAIGWGIPGQKIDFEKIEKNQNDVEEFVNKHLEEVRNFLVDLETHSIVAQLGEDLKDNEGNPDFVDFDLGDFHYGNYFTYSINKLEISNSSLEAVAVIANNKWTNSIQTVYLIDRNNGVKVVAEINDLHNKIIKEIESKIPGVHRKLFHERAPNLFLEKVRDSKLGYVTKISIYADIPKSDAPTVMIEGKLNLREENKKLDVKILDVKSKVVK